MASAVNFFELSQLAEASYVDFSNPDVSPKDALINGKFSSIQADLFLADWQVVTVGHQPNTESGYSSTLFKNTDGSYVLAFRGTEGLLSDDLWKADIGDLVGDGLAFKQIVDLYNEWQHITAAEGTSYTAAHLSESSPIL